MPRSTLPDPYGAAAEVLDGLAQRIQELDYRTDPHLALEMAGAYAEEMLLAVQHTKRLAAKPTGTVHPIFTPLLQQVSA